MNTKQRFKLGAGAGLVTMLLGALMVLAPGAGAEDDLVPIQESSDAADNPDCDEFVDLADVLQAKYDVQGNTVTGSFTASGDFDVDFTVAAITGGLRFTIVDTDLPIIAARVKQAAAKQGLSEEFNFAPALNDGGSFDYLKDTAFSNVRFCAGAPTLVVEKDVASQDQSLLDDTFPVSITKDSVVSASGNLADGDTLTVNSASGAYVVTETLPGGWQTPSLDCGSAAVSGTGPWTVTVGSASVACILTNTPEVPDEPELTVRKVVTDVEPATWSFDFEICDQEDFQAASASEVEGCDEFTLSRNDPGTEEAEHEKKFVSGLYSVVELGEDVEPAIVCTDSAGAPAGSVDGNGVYSVDVRQLDVTCVFTNPGDTPPPPPPPPGPSFSVGLEKLNDADSDGVFEDSESADAPGDDVDFQISIENTGGGPLTLLTLTDTFDGDTINLLTDVDLDCERNDAPVTLAVNSILPIGSTTVCTFTLDDYAPAAGTSLENVVEIDTVQTLPASDESTVSVAEVLPTATGRITVVKQVNPEAPDGWTFEFDGGELGTFELADGDEETSFNVDPGNFTITEEAVSGGWAFESAACVDQDDEVVGEADGDGSVDFAVAPDADVTCTFVNEYTAPIVAPAVVTPTTQPEKGLGVQTVRTLPRTGDETGGLAGVGAFMLALGAAMVIGSRRQLARR